VTTFQPATACGRQLGPCDRATSARRDRNQLCDNLKLTNGAYADYNLVPSRIVKHNLYHLPGSSTSHRALASLACAIHAVEDCACR